MKKAKKIIAYILAFSLCLGGMMNSSVTQAKVKVKKIILNCKKKQMYVGTKYKLKVKKVAPKRASKKVIWKSQNKKVASVSKTGVVKAKKPGKTVITVYSKTNKRVKVKCTITVKLKKSGAQGTTTEPSNIKPMPHVTATPTATPTITPENSKPTTTPSVKPSADPTKEPDDDKMCFVQFVDCDGSLLLEAKVKKGESVTPPTPPKRVGYLFSGWDKDYDNIADDITIKAMYEKDNVVALIVDDVVVNKEEQEVFLPVYVNQNPGILGMTLSVLFDDSKLRLVDAMNGDAVSNVLTLTKANVLKNNCKFTWDGQEINDSDVKDGQILVLRFKLKENIEPGEYNVNIYYNEGDIVDRNLQPIKFELRSGKLIVN